ncbi:MAG: RidA family protein [Pseudomonadota bacterium]
MRHKVIETPHAPKAIGPYSQGIVHDGYLFTAGQIPLDPATGALVAGDIKVQTRRVLENLKAVLTAAGLTFRDVVKTTVFLASMEDFPALNEIYAEYFAETKPARSTVAVAALPKGARVEIELVAAIRE